MLLGYGFSCFFMIMAMASKVAHVQCLFVVATMVTLFVLEPIQYQCSCMLPLFLFPISRLLVAHKLFGVYMNDEILRSISSVLVGLIALKSPLSRRLCLWFLCVTGVRVSRVLLSVMLLVFLVSMLVDANDDHGNTGRLRGSAHLRNLREQPAHPIRRTRPRRPQADATLTEVDFVFKDPAKQRRVVAGEARMNDTVEEVTQEVEPMFALDSEGNVLETVMVMDRNEGEVQKRPDLPTTLADNPEMRREQLSEALRSFGIDLQKMGLKLELQDSAMDAKSVKTVDYRTAVTHVSGAEDKLLLDDDNPGRESHLSLTTLKIHGKNRSSKTPDATTSKASKQSHARQGSADGAKNTNKDSASAAQKQATDGEEGASARGATPAASSPQHVQFSHVIYRAPSIPASCGRAADTGSAAANLFLRERIPHSHFMEDGQTVYQDRHAARASQGTLRDENASQWSTTAMIGTSKCSSESTLNETHPSKRHCEAHEKLAFSDNVFSGSNIEDFVLDFSGRLSGGQRRHSGRRKDVLKYKRGLLRRKRKSTDLPTASAQFEDPAA
ncbi:hypothetical protein MTO96_001662 [Rhipicephalus appendiculatus]